MTTQFADSFVKGLFGKKITHPISNKRQWVATIYGAARVAYRHESREYEMTDALILQLIAEYGVTIDGQFARVDLQHAGLEAYFDMMLGPARKYMAIPHYSALFQNCSFGEDEKVGNFEYWRCHLNDIAHEIGSSQI